MSSEITVPKLIRWKYTDIVNQYNYSGASLVSITWYYGFQNDGAPGNVTISGTGIDTTLVVQNGEKYWMEIDSMVNQFGDYGGINLTIRSGESHLFLLGKGPGYITGCLFLTLKSI